MNDHDQTNNVVTESRVEMADIAPCDIVATAGPKPSKSFVQSVRDEGVIVPILVARDGDAYDLIDGNRRVVAAQAAGLETIPAIIFSAMSHQAVAAMTLLANGQRASNPVTESNAITTLFDRGVDAKTISAMSGMSSGTLNKRQAIASVHPELHEGLSRGAISTTTMEAAAKCDRMQQDELAGIYRATRRLHGRDVDLVRNRLQKPVKAPPQPEITDQDLPYGKALKALLRAAQRTHMSLDETITSITSAWEEESS